MSMHIGTAALASLPTDVARPAYDRTLVTPGIVHLGIGAFHRAHQADYIDRLLGTDLSWGIVGASLRSPDTAEALNPQSGLYCLAVRDSERTSFSIIGSVMKVLVAPEDTPRLIDLLCEPAIRIVTLTVTEKGYCHDPATGDLDETHPDIIADLRPGALPRSAPGILVEALAQRRDAGIEPFTVLSCDNLPSNGKTVRRIVTRLASLRDPDLGRYVGEEVAFPSSMVDRIVPATTDADRRMVADALGMIDAWPVVTEPFSQWVVEDHFPTGRPRFEDVGVEMVTDVEPYERMKLRMLNGSHSTLAYLGYLAGYQTVAETMADGDFRNLIQGLMTEEIMPTLSVPGADLPAYRDALLRRFQNRGLQHRTWQIAADGSQKLPQRLLGTIRERLAIGSPIDRLTLGVAAWMVYATGTDLDGSPIDLRDPHRDRLAAIGVAAGRDTDRLVDGFLAMTDVFGSDLPHDGAFRAGLQRALASLMTDGSAATVRRLNQSLTR